MEDLVAMESRKSWREYYRSYLKADGHHAEFWLGYFDSIGFSGSPGPEDAPIFMVWHSLSGLLVGYNLVYETTAMWEFRFEDLTVSLFTSAIRSDQKYFYSVSEVLFVLEKLFIPEQLPLLLGTSWLAPIVAVFLQRSAAEKLPTIGEVLL